MKLGLMGGTFDPPHYAHLFIAEAARTQFNLEKVLFLPDRIPAHRRGKTTFASPEQRWQMTSVAIADNAHFEMSSIEMDREGPSYSYDTLVELRQKYTEVEIFYIIGGDSLKDLPTWYRSAELFDFCHFVVASRLGYDMEQDLQVLNKEQRKKVLLLDIPASDVSSSDIRMRVQRGQSIRYLLPNTVERVMRLFHLYQ